MVAGTMVHSLIAALAALSLCVCPSSGFSTPATPRRIFAAQALTNKQFVGVVGRLQQNGAFMMGIPSRLFADAAIDEIVQSDVVSLEAPLPPCDAVVCGGGPAGLLTAIMLAQSFDYKVKLYEKLPPPPSPDDESVWSDVAKFYLIGLGERGQAALREFGVWDDVEAACTAVPGRMDWAPDAGPDEGVERIFEDRKVQTQVLPRDKLVGVLHEHILKNYDGRIELEYGREVTPIDFGNDEGSSVLLGVADCASDFLRDTPSNVAQRMSLESPSLCDVENLQVLTTKLLVAADGTQRTVASQMELADREKRGSMSFVERLRYGKSFCIKRYHDDNQRVYKTIPVKLPEEWRWDLNYSARSRDGRILFDSLPADANGNQCAALLLKREDELAQENSDPKKLREAFDEVLPQFSAMLDDDTIKTVAKKPPSFLPSFRYATPRLNQGDRTILLGDAIHTVKPYFGLGANSALEDVQILKRSIESTTQIKEATHLFSEQRAAESKALVQISRELDRPGILGVFTFILPLVVDSIFNKLAPGIFSPNTIAMLQKSENTFRGIIRRKRVDRLLQCALLGSAFAVLGLGVRRLVRALSMATGRRATTVTAGLCAGVAAIGLSKRAATFLVPGLAPADVLNKASSSKSSEEE